MYSKKNNSRKILVVLLCVVMLIGGVIGGTLAYLMDTADPVVNTFSPANIKIDLTETFNTDSDGDNKVDTWQQEMVPGVTYTKDPVVSVDGALTDIDCYLFVRFKEEGNPENYLEYTSNLLDTAVWTPVPNTTDVWYRIVKVGDSVKSWHLLANDQITVKDTVTVENMATAVQAKLTYEAYAIQLQGFEGKVAEAWAAAAAQNPNP